MRRWARLAEQPRLFERLAEVLESHLGHDMAYAVEAGKIGANRAEAGRITLDIVERGMGADLGKDAMQASLAGFADEIAVCAMQTVRDAGVTPDSVDQVVFVGGSSLMAVIRSALRRVLPDARQQDSEVFTAVVHGLALASETQ